MKPNLKRFRILSASLLVLAATHSAFAHYEPSIGRWINRDPIGEWGGLNLFAYVGNNPIGEIDPYGLSQADACRILKTGQDTTKRLTDQGNRVDGPLNNLLSVATLGCKYYGCVKQADTAFQDLLAEEKKQRFDDRWDLIYHYKAPFEKSDYFPGWMPHNWVEAVSHNPTDPKVIVDPWANYIVGTLPNNTKESITPISNTYANGFPAVVSGPNTLCK